MAIQFELVAKLPCDAKQSAHSEFIALLRTNLPELLAGRCLRFPITNPRRAGIGPHHEATLLQAEVGSARNQRWAITDIPEGKALRTRIVKENSVVCLYVYIGDVARH
jgi:hypothetical protein